MAPTCHPRSMCSTPIPTGYTCPCGTLQPCSDPTHFCPASALLPLRVARGYYAVASSSASGTAVYKAQAACPVGSFCVDGVQLPCRAGTYGVARLQAAASGCTACPLGSYSSNDGAVGPASCLLCPIGSFADASGSAFCTPCPAGTANAARGGTSAAACSRCPESLASLTGASTCADPRTASLVYTGPLATAINVVAFSPSGALSDDALTRMFVTVLLPFFIVGIAPSAYLLVLKLARVNPVVSRSRVVQAVRAFLHARDLFATSHDYDDGTHPLILQSSLGGAVSILAYGIIACIASALVLQYFYRNTIVTTSLLPADLQTLQGFAGTPVFAVDGSTRIGIAPVTASRGLELRVAAFGPSCAAPSLSAAHELLAGNFSGSISATDPESAAWLFTFACYDCALSLEASVVLAFPPVCQAFVVTATAIGASGSTSVASFTVTGPSPVAISGGALLESAAITLAPRLEVVEDLTTGVSSRGYTIDQPTVVLATATAPAAVTLTIQVSVSDVYALVEAVQVRRLDDGWGEEGSPRTSL